MDVVVDKPRYVLEGGQLDTVDFADLGTCTDVLWQSEDLDLLVQFSDATLSQAVIDEVIARATAPFIPPAAGSEGAPGLTWWGPWSAARAYEVNDAVTYGGSSYRRIVAGTTATAPSADPGNWEVIAAAGDDGTPAATVTLTATTQALVSPAAGGATTPATSTVTGSALNTTISVYKYSVDGGAFSATVPAGVSRTGNDVTITGSTMTARTIAVRMADANGIADTLTVAKSFDGATGGAGADAYTVLLTDEAHVFPGSASAALAGSAVSQVIAYKGTVQQTATIGTITGQVAGLTTTIQNNGTTTAQFTVTVTTALTQQSGTLTVPVTVDGQTFTKKFSWSLSLTGPAGPPSDGNVPASSPAADVTSPANGQLQITWPTVANNDPVTYLVYLSTATPVVITAGNLLAQTPATSLTTGLKPDGTALVAGTRYYARVVASDRDGPAATAGTEDSAVVAGALVAPTATPVPDPHGNVREILLRLPPVSNATPSQVQVYVSTTSPVVLDSNHLHGLAEGTLYSIAALPAGLGGDALTTLAEGTPIYIVVRTVNAAGTGPASGEVSASLRKVDAADFAVGYLYAGEIDVGQLRGDTFQLGTGTVNEVAAQGVNGERVALAADGFTVTGPTSAGNPIYVDFPTDGSKPNIFSGTVEANTLEVLNGATLRSLFNMIASQGRLTLSSGVQAPQSPPATKIDWPTVNVDTTTKRSGFFGSFAFDPTAVTAMCWDGTRWLVAQTCKDDFGSDVSRIWAVTTAGAVSVWADTSVKLSGITWVAGKCYGIARYPSWLESPGDDRRLGEIQASGDFASQPYTRNNDTQEPTLGTDGTSILLAEVTPVTDVVRVKTFATSNLATPSATLTSPDRTSSNQLAGIARGTFDYGVTRIVSAAKGGSVTDFWSMDSAGTNQPNEAWPSAAAVLKAFGWDGTNFWGLGSGGQLFKHTTLKWTTESSKWWVGYTWADTNTTSSRTASITTNTTAGTQRIITTATAVFTAADVGSVITGTGIPAATTIVSVESSTSATMSANATAAGTITATIFSAAHETNLSAKSSFTMKKRAQVTVTTTAIPTGTAADDPNSLSIYLGRGAGTGSPLDLDRTLMYRQSTGSTTFTTFAPQFSVDASHPNPPLANNFPATAPGALVAGLGGAYLDGNSNGDVGTAGLRDSVRAALNGAYAEPWTTYTPSFTAATTNPTLANFTRTGRFIQRGKTVEFMIVITCNAASGFGTGNYIFGLPVAARAAAEVVVQANQELPNHNYLGRSGDATTVQLYLTSTDAVMTNTSSGMQSGTKIRISGTYEAA